METQKYQPHIFAICSLFVLGNAVITMPFYKSKSIFLFVLISLVFSLFIICITSLLLNLSTKSKFIFYITAAAVSAAAIHGAVSTVIDYLGFIKSVQLPQTSIFLSGAAIILTVVAFLFVKSGAIYKYGLLVALISGVFILIVFISGLKSFDFSILKTALNKTDISVKELFYCFSSCAVLPAFVFLTNDKSLWLKYTLGGTATGFSALTICAAQSIFTLGNAMDISYPYIKAVSIISSGSLFTRIDGFVYFVFFSSAIIKITVCIWVLVLSLNHIYKKTEDF